MAHDIQKRDSQVGTSLAWHGLTEVVDKVTADNCRILYPMALQRLVLPSGVETDHYIAVAGDDGKPVGGPVGERYTLIDNQGIWQAVEDALVGTDHEVVSVGTVGDRERGYISVKLSDSFVAAGRKTESVLSVLWGHGGCMQVVAKTGLTVVVCRNTFNLSLTERGEFNFQVRHTGSAAVKLANMRQAIEAHSRAVEVFTESMDAMHAQAVSLLDASRFFHGFQAPAVPAAGETVSGRTRNQIAALDRLFSYGRGNQGKTAADLFNAVTDYYSHESAGGADNPLRQFESSEFGTGQMRKQAAWLLLNGDKAPGLGDLDAVLRRGDAVMARVGA